jgi:ribosomal protein L7/L12
MVEKIENGYLIYDHSDESNVKIIYVKDFDITMLMNLKIDHEKALIELVSKFPVEQGKIPAIKAVREYCATNNYSRYQGLKEAKDFVELQRVEWRPKMW